MHRGLIEETAIRVQRGDAAKRMEYRAFTEAWVEEAITAGCRPRMQQQPLSNEEFAGEWLLVVSAAGFANPLYPGSLPDQFLDEAFFILERLGHVKHARDLRPWHGNVFLDDTSSRAVVFRVKLVREALNLDCKGFYEAMGIPASKGEAFESGRFGYTDLDQELAQPVCAYYDTPEEWLTHGAAEEIELHSH